MRFRNMRALPPASLRMLLPFRRRMLTAAVKSGEGMKFFILKGNLMIWPPQEALQSIGDAISTCSLALKDSEVMLSNFPQGGGVIDTVVLSKHTGVETKKDIMKLEFDLADKACSIVRIDKFGFWEISRCFNMIPIPKASAMDNTSLSGDLAGDYFLKGPLPESIKDHFLIDDYGESPYGLKELLGEGGQARVYRGESPVDGHQAAIRCISTVTKKRSGEPYARGFFESTIRSEYEYLEFDGEYLESDILRNLNHLNIKKMSIGWVFDDDILIAQEYCESTLHDLLIAGVSDCIKDKLSIGVFKALQYLWRKKVMHKDIKPQNLFVDKDFNVKIGDFGSASILEHGSFTSGTRKGSTLMYAAQEIFGLNEHDHMVDTYGGGCVYFNIHITGTSNDRFLLQNALQDLTRSPEWILNPQEAWARSPLKSHFTGSPEVLFATMAFKSSDRLPYEQILELIYDWISKNRP